MNKPLGGIAALVHENAVNHGFYDNGIAYADRIACLHEEVSELFHAYRKGTLGDPCDKEGCPPSEEGVPLTNEEEELADIIIRVLDLAAARDIDIDWAVRVKHGYNVSRPRLHGDAQAPGDAGG